MNKLLEINKRRIVAKIRNDLSDYLRYINENEHETMHPEEQISKVLNYLRNEEYINDLRITCDEPVSDNSVLNVKVEIAFKPDYILYDNEEN